MGLAEKFSSENFSPSGNGGARVEAAFADLIPRIETPRLVLRAPTLADFPAYEAVFTSDRARFMDGPFTPDQAWADFCEAVAGWLLRNAGMWTLTEHRSDVPLGWIYLWQERGDPEPEIGWVLVAEAEGKGFALEAARAVLPRAIARFGIGGFVSYIDADNHPSARIAARLGARRDPVAEAALGDAGLHVWRHWNEEPKP